MDKHCNHLVEEYDLANVLHDNDVWTIYQKSCDEEDQSPSL